MIGIGQGLRVLLKRFICRFAKYKWNTWFINIPHRPFDPRCSHHCNHVLHNNYPVSVLHNNYLTPHVGGYAYCSPWRSIQNYSSWPYNQTDANHRQRKQYDYQMNLKIFVNFICKPPRFPAREDMDVLRLLSLVNCQSLRNLINRSCSFGRELSVLLPWSANVTVVAFASPWWWSASILFFKNKPQ